MARIKDWRQLAANQLWEEWRKLFPNDTAAIARLTWTLNRLVKVERGFDKDYFYRLKDEFIARHQDDLVDGRTTRVERIPCPLCEGDGSLKYDYSKCPMCSGTGCHKTRTLFQHDFVIEGQGYSFHSYLRPRLVSDEPGQDLPEYGARFTAAELRGMPLPFEGLMSVLEYVGLEMWGVHPRPTEEPTYEHVKKDFVSVSGMKLEFGLTDSLIKKIGEPDRFNVNPHYRTAPKTRLYKRERVEQWVADNRDLIKRAA